MSKFSIFSFCQLRNKTVHSFKNIRSIFCSTTFYDENKNDQESDSDSKRKEAKKKLEELLVIMMKESADSAKKINIPKPRQDGKQKYLKQIEERKEIMNQLEKKKLSNRLAEAATKVAEVLGGDTKKTEEELLELYLYGEKKPSSEAGKPKESLKNILSSMKVEKETDNHYVSRAAHVHAFKKNTPSVTSSYKFQLQNTEKVDIFSGKPLDIFSLKKDDETLPTLDTWNHLFERDLRLSVTHPPSNIFEQLILWTEQGKIWKFPIDNEQDWFEEEKVDFMEHVFLERWIEPWCPKTGPIRHFMELVCTGLSKNPYLTVQEKKEHISFYENYFRCKNELLQEIDVGIIPDKKSQQLAVE